MQPPPIKVGDRFKHFKTGGYYVVTGFFTWEPTKEQSIEYENEKTKERWGRPLTVFLEEVAGPDGTHVPRFQKVADTKEIVALYALKELYDDRGQPYWQVHHWGGDVIATLKDGQSAIIALSFINMSKQEHRGDDYRDVVLPWPAL